MVLVMGGIALIQLLPVRSDLTAFLPGANNSEEQLLVEQLQAGNGSGLMLAAINHAENHEKPKTKSLAQVSERLAEQLRQAPQFKRVENGNKQSQDKIQAWVFAHRYHLSPQMSAQRFTEAGLHKELQDRLIDLSSPADVVIKDLLARDPTGETLAILNDWSGMRPPKRKHGVWFDRSGKQALLLIETHAPGFDLDAQEAAQQRINQALQTINADNNTTTTLTLSGPGPFGVTIRERTRSQAQGFSIFASIALALLLLLVFRHPAPVLLCGLPLATGILVGTATVWCLFGYLHGITLAFGVTVLGVAIDYPIHFYGHCEKSSPPTLAVKRIWPTLLLGMVSTCLAYLAMALSGVDGLAQLGSFTIAGLVAAVLSVRFLLPHVVSAESVPALTLGRLIAPLTQIKIPPALGISIVGVILISLFLTQQATQKPIWQNDLSTLSPVPQDLLDQDGDLREAIGAPEPRYQVAVVGSTLEDALQRAEKVVAELAKQQGLGTLEGYEAITRFLPSQTLQNQRLAALPDAETLQQDLDKALEGLPFRKGHFAPFITETARIRDEEGIDLQSLQRSPFAGQISALLQQRPDNSWVAILPLRGVTDAELVAQAVNKLEATLFIDLKATSEDMVQRYRSQMLTSILFSLVGIILLTLIGLRSLPGLCRVLLPVLATTLLCGSILRFWQGPLNLFHLVSLLLVAGLVLDYSLFLNRRESAMEKLRSRSAVVLCGVSTFTVFGILGFSDIPVLQAIGMTVAVGICCGLPLASLLASTEIEGEGATSGHSQ